MIKALIKAITLLLYSILGISFDLLIISSTMVIAGVFLVVIL